MEYFNQLGINVHTHLPIASNCCDIITWATLVTVATLNEVFVQVFLRFSNSSKPVQSEN